MQTFVPAMPYCDKRMKEYPMGFFFLFIFEKWIRPNEYNTLIVENLKSTFLFLF